MDGQQKTRAEVFPLIDPPSRLCLVCWAEKIILHPAQSFIFSSAVRQMVHSLTSCWFFHAEVQQAFVELFSLVSEFLLFRKQQQVNSEALSFYLKQDELLK
ncbi:hypothetical protein ILYODFUR_032554 [Ilyodon furcidens]|uniref:Uncharacterized protein n=1 Tax=Ilyodon furcidens TaxID=33524 RepID=A0ABV0TNP6_9TELE